MDSSPDRLRNLIGEWRAALARMVVTGAAGFIGSALCRHLTQQGHAVTGLTRGLAAPASGMTLRAVGDIGPETDWTPHLAGADCVIHLAGSAHRPPDPATGAREAEAAASLARGCAGAGVRRLIQVSSVRAMAAETPPGRPLTSADRARPQDDYGRLKLAVEAAVTQAAADAGIELAILRPPLVYGPGVKGNLRALLRLVASGLPLPFAAVDNRRSLIHLDNLASLIEAVAVHPAAAGAVWLMRDADWSTPDLIRTLAAGLGRRPRLVALPPRLLAVLSAVPPVAPALSRLTRSLQVDDAATRQILGWRPVVAANTGLVQTAADFAVRR